MMGLSFTACIHMCCYCLDDACIVIESQLEGQMDKVSRYALE